MRDLKCPQRGVVWCLGVGRSTALLQLQQKTICQHSPSDIWETSVDDFLWTARREHGTSCSRSYAGASPCSAWEALQWCHNERSGLSNHRRLDYLVNHLFRRKSKKISKLPVTGPLWGEPPITGGFPAQRAVTRKMFPFDYVIKIGYMEHLDLSKGAVSTAPADGQASQTPCWRHYDDVIKWKHFPRYWPFVRGIDRWSVDSPHKGPVRRSFDAFFHLRLNERLSKQPRRQWLETSSRSLWLHCDDSIKPLYWGNHWFMADSLYTGPVMQIFVGVFWKIVNWPVTWGTVMFMWRYCFDSSDQLRAGPILKGLIGTINNAIYQKCQLPITNYLITLVVECENTYLIIRVG